MNLPRPASCHPPLGKSNDKHKEIVACLAPSPQARMRQSLVYYIVVAMSPEERLYNAEQSIDRSRAALFSLSSTLMITPGHIPSSEEVERQRYEATHPDGRSLYYLNVIEDGFREVRENGFEVTFNSYTTVSECEHGHRVAAETRLLREPIIARCIGKLAIVGEQISKRRYGRRVTAVVVSEPEGFPQEERLNLIDHNGSFLNPRVLPYQRPRYRRKVPTAKGWLAPYKV